VYLEWVLLVSHYLLLSSNTKTYCRLASCRRDETRRHLRGKARFSLFPFAVYDARHRKGPYLGSCLFTGHSGALGF